MPPHSWHVSSDAAQSGLSDWHAGQIRTCCPPATARTHVSRSMGKIGARDRAQVVVFAYEVGLVVPSRRPNST